MTAPEGAQGRVEAMASKDRFQKRARVIQKDTGWSYSECLRLAREGITSEGLETLRQIRSGPKTINHDAFTRAANAVWTKDALQRIYCPKCQAKGCQSCSTQRHSEEP